MQMFGTGSSYALLFQRSVCTSRALSASDEHSRAFLTGAQSIFGVSLFVRAVTGATFAIVFSLPGLLLDRSMAPSPHYS